MAPVGQGCPDSVSAGVDPTSLGPDLRPGAAKGGSRRSTLAGRRLPTHGCESMVRWCLRRGRMTCAAASHLRAPGGRYDIVGRGTVPDTAPWWRGGRQPRSLRCGTVALRVRGGRREVRQ
jgi:hypothetical protein